MRLLIDTHVLLWWRNEDAQLSPRAKRIIDDPGNEVILSIASLWEMSIKFRTGKLATSGAGVFQELLARRIKVLDIRPGHLAALETLANDLRHKDPFDHMMLAQAKAEGIPLLTGDRKMTGYGVACIGAR